MRNRKPNILLIMADQLTAALTGAYDHPVVKTNSLNRMVEKGVRFDVAYSNCPVCAPARGALMTGRYGGTGKILFNSGQVAQRLSRNTQL